MNKSIWKHNYKVLRNELKRIRKNAGLTQVQLAKLLEKNQSHVAKYELGERSLDYLEVINVCNLCGVVPEEFMKAFRKLIKK